MIELLDAWSRWDQSEPRLPLYSAFNAVAREIGGRAAAVRLLRASLPAHGRVVAASSFAGTVASAGLVETSRRHVPERALCVWSLRHGPAAVPRRDA